MGHIAAMTLAKEALRRLLSEKQALDPTLLTAAMNNFYKKWDRRRAVPLYASSTSFKPTRGPHAGAVVRAQAFGNSPSQAGNNALYGQPDAPGFATSPVPMAGATNVMANTKLYLTSPERVQRQGAFTRPSADLNPPPLSVRGPRALP